MEFNKYNTSNNFNFLGKLLILNIIITIKLSTRIIIPNSFVNSNAKNQYYLDNMRFYLMDISVCVRIKTGNPDAVSSFIFHVCLNGMEFPDIGKP